MSSEVETSLIIRCIARDGKPGLADYVGCVAASATLGMANRAVRNKKAGGGKAVARAHIGVAVNRPLERPCRADGDPSAARRRTNQRKTKRRLGSPTAIFGNLWGYNYGYVSTAGAAGSPAVLVPSGFTPTFDSKVATSAAEALAGFASVFRSILA